MVPNISPNGRSFRGAGAYHLHDKPDAATARPRTSGRVSFTAARNLANADPHAALDEMWRTAEDARYLKARSGLAPTGRTNETPVKTVSLAWAPGQSPTREEMCRAADNFMKAMGWTEHQTLIVAHNDTRHPHLHLIINRVHPDTGRALNDWQERKRAQVWAFGYEKAHGEILCPARAVTHEAEARLKNTPAGLPYRQARLLNAHAAAPRQQIAKAIRAAFRPRWAAHYRRQRAALHRFHRDRRSVERKADALLRASDTVAAMKTLQELDRRQDALLRSFRLERATIARAQHAAVRNRLAEAPSCPTALATRAQGDRNFPNPSAAPANDRGALPGPLHLMPSSSPSSFRYAALRAGARFGVSQPSSRPRLLLAWQAAACDQTRLPRSASAEAATLARAEIAVLFAHRWAAIRRLPPEERAAAATALQAEQAAALDSRLKEVLGRLHQENRTRRLQLRGHRAAGRSALSLWRRDHRAGLAVLVQARRRSRVSGRTAPGAAVPTP
jgi:hypothetical protein